MGLVVQGPSNKNMGLAQETDLADSALDPYLLYQFSLRQRIFATKFEHQLTLKNKQTSRTCSIVFGPIHFGLHILYDKCCIYNAGKHFCSSGYIKKGPCALHSYYSINKM